MEGHSLALAIRNSGCRRRQWLICSAYLGKARSKGVVIFRLRGVLGTNSAGRPMASIMETRRDVKSVFLDDQRLGKGGAGGRLGGSGFPKGGSGRGFSDHCYGVRCLMVQVTGAARVAAPVAVDGLQERREEAGFDEGTGSIVDQNDFAVGG